jgi:hypothetical protein
MTDVPVAETIGQWVEIEDEDRIVFLHAKSTALESTQLSSHDCREIFLERLRISRSRQGSSLKHEYDPDASKYWKCVKIDGRSQWVQADWSEEPPRLWGFDSDSDDSDDEYTKRSHLPKATESTLRGRRQPKEVQSKSVSLGETTFCEYSTYDGESAVRFGEISVLDHEELNERTRSFGVGGKTTIESSKETKLRRTMWAPISRSHDCQSCIERQVSFDEQDSDSDDEMVPLTRSNVIEIPEVVVTAIDEREKSEALVETADELKIGNEALRPMKQLGDDGNFNSESAATTGNAPEKIKTPTLTPTLRSSTIRFAAINIIKESPANHLPTLKIFPDFCTASKPIFRPDYRKQTERLCN